MLQKPFNINLRGNVYDSSEVIKAIWQVSGDLSVAYQLKLYNNATSALAYDSGKITSFAANHTVPSNSIANGNEYKIQITIWNNSNASISSDFEIFSTSSRPVVTIDPISIVGSQSYTFDATYHQAQSVIMRSWIIYLYNSDQVKIHQSDIRTTTDLSYLISNLQTNSTYYIEYQVTSNKGLVGTSGLVQFNVMYDQPRISINLTAENTDKAGIKLSWKTIQIIGDTINNPIFIDNQKLDVRNDTFIFSEGFRIDNNFTMKIWFENIESDIDLLHLKGINGDISLQYWSSDNRFHLFKEQYGYKAHYTSPALIGSSFFIVLQQIDSDMNIEGEVLA